MLRVLHGDAHAGNLLRFGDDCGWGWIDFEETCRGLRKFDFAVLASTSQDGAPRWPPTAGKPGSRDADPRTGATCSICSGSRALRPPSGWLGGPTSTPGATATVPKPSSPPARPDDHEVVA